MREFELFSDEPLIIQNVLLLDDTEFHWLVWDGEFLYNRGAQVSTENLMHFDLNGVTYYRCIDGLLRP